MLGKTFSVTCILFFGCALYTGNMRALSDGIIDIAAKAVSLTLSLLGAMCLWCGVMRPFSYVGLIGGLPCASALSALRFSDCGEGRTWNRGDNSKYKRKSFGNRECRLYRYACMHLFEPRRL